MDYKTSKSVFNLFIKKGKKAKKQKIIKQIFLTLKKKYGINPKEIIKRAFIDLTPFVFFQITIVKRKKKEKLKLGQNKIRHKLILRWLIQKIDNEKKMKKSYSRLVEVFYKVYKKNPEIIVLKKNYYKKFKDI